MLISLCMIVKNEEKVLDRCLNSVIDLVDEIIIVDTGSSDGSRAIAERHGAKVFSFGWTDDFSAARNYALQKASGKWILHLDADEKLDNESAASLKALLQKSTSHALEVTVRNHQPQGDIARYSDDRQLRLFRNMENIRYRNRVHEQIGPSIVKAGYVIEESPLVVHHYGYTGENSERLQRNLALLLAEYRQEGDDGYLFFKLGETYKGLGNWTAAAENLKKSLKIFEQTPQNDLKGLIHLRLAQIALLNNDYNAALKHAQEAIRLGHENDIASYIKGIALMYSGQAASAVELFKVLVKNDRGQVDLSDVKKLLQAMEALV